mmetsp:Transcript_49953/g.159767  ORF Transcript_49953/g.159767 Transcript_49953/m.159767 type:complete len:315 (-) Transcript_49953:1769-2713(-)
MHLLQPGKVRCLSALQYQGADVEGANAELRLLRRAQAREPVPALVIWVWVVVSPQPLHPPAAFENQPEDAWLLAGLVDDHEGVESPGVTTPVAHKLMVSGPRWLGHDVAPQPSLELRARTLLGVPEGRRRLTHRADAYVLWLQVSSNVFVTGGEDEGTRLCCLLGSLFIPLLHGVLLCLFCVLLSIILLRDIQDLLRFSLIELDPSSNHLGCRRLALDLGGPVWRLGAQFQLLHPLAFILLRLFLGLLHNQFLLLQLLDPVFHIILEDSTQFRCGNLLQLILRLNLWQCQMTGHRRRLGLLLYLLLARVVVHHF